MSNRPTPLLLRDDTFFGVCQGLGEDLRIPPNLIRLGFAALLFFDPQIMAITYVAAGIVVLTARLIFPNPRRAKTAKAAPAAAERAEVAVEAPEAAERLDQQVPLAA